MATIVKTKDKTEIKRQQKEFINLILQKAGITRNELIDHAERKFVIQNLDLITEVEAKKYQQLLLFYGEK
ncbi:hypothetical protein FACS1894123_02280 [Bacteroidia bacterium]|nr:hypothetical protein FACS1894123_02280 [Bacteroidia bacterium]